MVNPSDNTAQLSRFEAAVLDALAIGSAVIIALSFIYSAYRLTPWITLPVLLIGAGYWIYLFLSFRPTSPRGAEESLDQSNQRDLSATPRASVEMTNWIYAVLLTVGLDIFLLGSLLGARTDAAIVSPWQILPGRIFIVYGLASVGLFISLKTASRPIAIGITTLHLAVTWGVALFVYKLGFGYDPFVHQATERFILAHGSIEPKQPFYIGQYAIVVALSHLTQLSSDLIDQWLVPIAAITILPIVASVSLIRLPKKSAQFLGLSALFLIPLSAFTFTIPHNLSLVLLCIILLLLPIADELHLNWHILAISFAICTIHPLLGIPAVLMAITHILCQKNRWKFAWALPCLGNALFLPMSFIFYNYQHGLPIIFPTFTDVTRALSILFNSPYTTDAVSSLSLFYSAMHLWPFVFCLLGLYGYWKYDHFKSVSTKIILSSVCGLILAAIGLASSIRLQNILPGEQFEFALRLISALPIFFLPGLMHHVVITRRLGGLVTIVFVLIATSIWFVTYPQYNAIAYFNAPSMSAADLHAVKAIEDRAVGSSYAVLSHQLMSAAALRTFGFERTIQTSIGERYPYAIPTGGELYARYLALFTSESIDQWKQETRDLLQQDNIFIAIPTSWDPNLVIHQKLKSIAHWSQNIDEQIWVYEL